VHQTWIYEFDDLVNGSFTIKRQMSGDFISWRNTNPTSYLARWDVGDKGSHRVVVSTTGDLKGFHFSDFGNKLGTRWYWAIGHFSPRDSNPLP
jgi:hypothetical protein